MELITKVVYSLVIILMTSTLCRLIADGKPTKSTTVPAFWEHVNKTCLSRECDEHVNIKHLQHLATHMNRSIDPCENFHEYACSQWKSQHSENTMMSVGERQLTQKYQQIFEEFRERPTLRRDRVQEKLQLYYDLCLLSEREEKASWRAYVEAMRAMGYLQLTNETHWLETLRDLNLYSDARFFISAHVERCNTSHFMLNIYPHHTMDTANLTEEIYAILKHYNYTTESREQLVKQFKHLELALESILANKDDDLSETMTWAELLQNNSSTLNWELLLTGFSMAPQDPLIVNDLDAVERVKQYLDSCSPRTLFLYSLTRFINHLQTHDHNVVAKGSSPFSCLRHMRKIFPLTMNYIYDRVFYDPQHRALSDPVIESVFSQLKQQFSLRLENNQMQFSAESLLYLKKKLNAMQLNIGNLPKNVTPEFYEEFISDLNITTQLNFYSNHLQALRHFYRRQRLLGSPGKFSAVWFSFNLHMPDFRDNMDSTAYYMVSANYIVLPFAYLQLPFYDHRFWPSLLYGDLANTLGHELIHAFDSRFLMYDYGGNYNEQESAQILGNAQFRSNIDCLSKEETAFLTERIADISGTRLALRTFAKDPQFLKYNGKLFFLQFAQFFCGSADEATFALLDGDHDLDSVRLNYTLAHMPEFAEVFECPLGSPMNPIEKCKLW